MAIGNIFVISDTHFGHANMYNFMEADGAPVRKDSNNLPVKMEDFDELMVQNWNDTVKDGDIIYHLGDVYFGLGHQHLWKLKGRKRLILGNHDNGKDQNLHKVFEKILMWRMFPEWEVLLSHTAQHESALGGKVKYNFHGHIHRKPNISPVHLNCSVEVQNYTPKSVEDLMKQLKHGNSEQYKTNPHKVMRSG